MRPFVQQAVDLDLNTPPTPPLDLEDLPIPTPRISDELPAELTDAVGIDNVHSDDLDRIVHTSGKSLRDLMRLRAGDIPPIPDVVLYPGEESEVQPIVDRVVTANAVLIPFGGGSNISAASRRRPRRPGRWDIGESPEVCGCHAGQGARRTATAPHINRAERLRDDLGPRVGWA